MSPIYTTLHKEPPAGHNLEIKDRADSDDSGHLSLILLNIFIKNMVKLINVKGKKKLNDL